MVSTLDLLGQAQNNLRLAFLARIHEVVMIGWELLCSAQVISCLVVERHALAYGRVQVLKWAVRSVCLWQGTLNILVRTELKRSTPNQSGELDMCRGSTVIVFRQGFHYR